MSQTTNRMPVYTHEKDERWTNVDNYAAQQLRLADSPHYDSIQYALRLSEEQQFPSIEVSPLQGKYLATNCQMIDAKYVLEVGTLGGVSSLWLASSSPDVKVTTIEIDPKHKACADQAIAHAGLIDRIEVLLGAGVDVLPKIREEVESGKRPKFDFVFIDADKENNLNYFNEAVLMCRSRAAIIVDNVVRRGMVADEEAARSDKRVEGARKVIEAVGKDERILGKTLLQTTSAKNYDGFLLCVVK